MKPRLEPRRSILDVALAFVPAVLLAFLVLIYVTVQGAASDASREAAARAEAAAGDRVRIEQILENLEERQRVGDETVGKAIADIIDEARLSVDCVYLRGRGLRPLNCKPTNDRIDALGRGEGFPRTPPRIPPAPPRPAPTTGTPPAPRPPAPAPAPAPPVTQPPLPEGRPPTTVAPAPDKKDKKCTVDLLGVCI